MKPFSHHYFLGYVNEITPQYIKVHFPSSNLLNKFYHEGVKYAGGNVGNFIVIEGEEYGFLARIIELNLPESERMEMNEKDIKNDDTRFHPSGKAELLLCFNVFEPKETKKTVSKYPAIGAKVYSCSDEQISQYVQEFGKKQTDDSNIYASIGKLTSNDSICNVSLNSLFGRHCAVVGTTGGGKSWTVSKLIETITTKTSNKIILIDATGEFSKLKCKSAVLGEDSYFDYKFLKNTDFCFLFQENSPNTVAALCEAIHSLKLISLNVSEFNGTKSGKSAESINKIVRENIHRFKDCNFDISKLPEQIKNEAVKIKSKGIYEDDEFKLGYCSHLIARINLLLQNDTIKNALGIEKTKDSNIVDIVTTIDAFLKNSQTENQILRIGFEKLSYDFAIREIIVDFIASNLLQKAR
ncbi:MAG: ATP-binding protein, partial [Crenarchaeota archaeon]|nr:ATP-binding protein [Thermoproteota archaeon]